MSEKFHNQTTVTELRYHTMMPGSNQHMQQHTCRDLVSSFQLTLVSDYLEICSDG